MNEKPSLKWSPQNQIIMQLNGTNDARGYHQWREAGRQVKRGAKAFYILGPVMGKSEDSEEMKPKSFVRIPVFRIEDTEPLNREG